MLTGRRYMLAFTDSQAAYAETVGDLCRAVWNTGLHQRREYRRRGAAISYVEQARQMAEAKQDPACAWLAEAPSHTLQQTLRHLPPKLRATYLVGQAPDRRRFWIDAVKAMAAAS